MPLLSAVVLMLVVVGVLVNNYIPMSLRRMNRADRLGLDSYAQKSRCEGAFPYDYLSR